MRDLLQTSFYFSFYTSFADRLLKPVKGYFAPIFPLFSPPGKHLKT